MERQSPQEELPKILTTLVDLLIKLEAHKSEGIFRVPGDAEGVSGRQILIIRSKVPN